MTKPQSLRVGFVLPGDNWLGGGNYLRNLFAAIHTLPDNPITPVIFTGKHQGANSASFPNVEIVKTSILDRKSPAWFAWKVTAKAIPQDIILGKLMRRNGISVLSHSLHLDGRLGIKTIGWIPDFQHVRSPEFFNPKELRYRDLEFMSLCERCDNVIVSSECARTDFYAFAPKHANKAKLLRFVASPMPLVSAASLSELQRLYSFNSPFFLLPNQFWAHKNHRVVLSALQLLKRRGEPLLVLATGSSEDHRNPSFFRSLMQYAADCDVLDCFRVLGIVPFDHLVGLMQHSIAFINPSKFEGWSTSVEEAKSMGKQIVLSDIPVHREQAPERGSFFPPEDPAALGETMLAVYNGFDAKQDAETQDIVRAQFVERQRQFGETFQRIVEGVTGRQISSL